MIPPMTKYSSGKALLWGLFCWRELRSEKKSVERESSKFSQLRHWFEDESRRAHWVCSRTALHRSVPAGCRRSYGEIGPPEYGAVVWAMGNRRLTLAVLRSSFRSPHGNSNSVPKDWSLSGVLGAEAAGAKTPVRYAGHCRVLRMKRWTAGRSSGRDGWMRCEERHQLPLACRNNSVPKILKEWLFYFLQHRGLVLTHEILHRQRTNSLDCGSLTQKKLRLDLED